MASLLFLWFHQLTLDGWDKIKKKPHTESYEEEFKTFLAPEFASNTDSSLSQMECYMSALSIPVAPGTAAKWFCSWDAHLQLRQGEPESSLALDVYYNKKKVMLSMGRAIEAEQQMLSLAPHPAQSSNVAQVPFPQVTVPRHGNASSPGHHFSISLESFAGCKL